MRLVADSGLWSTGQLAAPPPLAAVLEVSGAVLSWTVDDPSAAAQITFTDPARADWLWRVLGESGHSALAAALDGRTPRRGRRTHRRRRAARSRSNRCGGWPSGTGCAGGGPPASATASRPSTARSSTPRSRVLTAGAAGLLHRRHLRLRRGGSAAPARRGAERTPARRRPASDRTRPDLRRPCRRRRRCVRRGRPACPAPRRLRACRGLGSGPARFRRDRHGQPTRSTGAPSRPASSTRPSTPSTWRVEAADGVTKAVVRVELSGPGLASGIAVRLRSGDPRWRGCARRRRRSGVPGRRRAAAARHGIGCVGS